MSVPASKIFFKGVTHEDVLANMDPHIVGYIDPSLPLFRCEYSRTKARLMGKSTQLEEKNARKAENLKSQIRELKQWIYELVELGQIKFDQAVGRRKSDLAKFYKSKMTRGVCHCLSRFDFTEENLRAFLTIRYKGCKEKFINTKLQILKREIDYRFECCIDSFRMRLRAKENQLKLYEP